MKKFQLPRRTFIRGAGSIAIALPWIEVMGTDKRAHAAPAARFVTVYQPGGTVRAKWKPTGTETNFTLSPILAPLEPVKSKLLVLSGIDMASARGEQHQAGIVAWLTGSVQIDDGYSYGPSIDQLIAQRISAGKKPRASIQMAVRWATGESKGRLSPINAAHYETTAPYSPIPPRLDPQEIWTDMFGSLRPPSTGGTTPAPTGPDPLVARKKSILDLVDKKYAALSQKLGTADRQKIDQHLTKIRELENSLTLLPTPTTPAGTCAVPAKVDTTGYNPKAGLMADDAGNVKDLSTDAQIPAVGKFMMDMLVLALACDLTAVASLQWCDTEAKHTFPWLSLKDHHHFYQHDGGFQPVPCEKIGVWYSQQHAYLLQAMASIDMGGRSLLDESVVFFGSELSDPPSHDKTQMPFLLAGNGGGLRTGRFLQYNAVSHNNLLVALLNLFGDPRTTIGTAQYSTGVINNLT